MNKASSVFPTKSPLTILDISATEGSVKVQLHNRELMFDKETKIFARRPNSRDATWMNAHELSVGSEIVAYDRNFA